MTEILFGNRHYRIGSAIPCLAVDDFGGANGGGQCWRRSFAVE